MTTLIQILGIAIMAIIGFRTAKGKTRTRIFTFLKAWITVFAFWMLFSHQIDGVSVLQLIMDQIERIDAATFWTFVLIATGIKIIGMLSSPAARPSPPLASALASRRACPCR